MADGGFWGGRLEAAIFGVIVALVAGLVVGVILHFAFGVTVVHVSQYAPAHHRGGGSTTRTSTRPPPSTSSTTTTTAPSGPIPMLNSNGKDLGDFIANSNFATITGSSEITIDAVPESTGLTSAFYSGHADSVDFILEGKYSAFTARIGVGDLSPTGCNVTYQVTTPSGTTIYGPVTDAYGQAQNVSIPVSGLVKITLSSIFGGSDGENPCAFGIGNPSVTP